MFRLIALVSTMLLSPAASAFSAFDECGALEIALKEQQFSLELDTPYAEISKSHGLRVTFGDDVEEFEYPYISFVHPDFFDDTDDQEAYELQYEIADFPVRSINGIDIGEIDSEAFAKEFDLDEITLVIEGIDGDISLASRKRDFSSSPIFVSATLEEVRGISTKSNTFSAIVSERTSWSDRRIDGIAQSILQEASRKSAFSEQEASGFYCVLSDEFLRSISFPLPNVEPKDFEYTESTARARTIVFEHTNLECTSLDEDCEKYSEFLREQYGVEGVSLSLFEVRERYAGKFFDSFDLRKFPFDNHALVANFGIDHLRAPYFYEIKKDPFAIDAAGKAFQDYDSTNSGWSFVDYNVWESNDYYPPLNKRLPLLQLEVNVERQSSYYVSKIMLPILLVLLMAWSIFWVDIKQLESRLTIGIVCLLSLIAYNFVIESEIPKLGYVTLMDTFILISYLFAGSTIAATVFIRYLHDKDKFKFRSEAMNFAALCATPVLYLAAIIAMGLYFLT